MAPLQYTCPQDHWGKDNLTPCFSPLRKKAMTSLPLEAMQLSWDLRLLFSWNSLLEFLPKTVSIATCRRAMARAGGAVICYWTFFAVTPKQEVSYIPGKTLQQNHQWFELSSAVQTWCKWKQSSGSPALYLTFLPTSLPLAKALMKMSKPNALERGRERRLSNEKWVFNRELQMRLA